MAKKKLTREEQWAEDDRKLEEFCRFDLPFGPRIISMPEVPDPWIIALREGRKRRRRNSDDDGR